MPSLKIRAALQILKNPSEVFEAIVNPEQMKNYFISESTGRMEEGAQISWRFSEFDMNVPVRVGRVEQDRHISYYWQGPSGKDLLVEMTLTPFEGNATVVTITEGEMENDAEGIQWLMGNTEGWANFLACLKAWLEYSVHLRRGAFEFRRGEF